METSVAFFVFNRPDTTERVFGEIARAKPKKLLLVADGARESVPGEAELCRQTRSILERVDWDCEVLTNFSEVNLGCSIRISSGLKWVFDQVEEAIILEDDCLPHPTFFPFCSELLERYRNDERVMLITGNNYQLGRKRCNESYYFSKLLHIWGWASWRRAWKLYDYHMTQWPALRETDWLSRVLGGREYVKYWLEVFDGTHSHKLNTWDFQATFACWLNGKLNITPNANMVSNIGFGAGATHTNAENWTSNLPVFEMEFPLAHPLTVEQNWDADRFVLKKLSDDADQSITRRIKLRAAKLLGLR